MSIKSKGGDHIMPNIRKAMNKISRGVLSGVAAIALMVTTTNISTCCWFILGQDKLPDNAKKLRKF